MRTLLLTAALAFAGCTTEDLGSVDTTSATATSSATKPDGGSGSNESTAACDGKAASDACSFSDKSGTTVTGTCQTCGPSGPLMCSNGTHTRVGGDGGHAH